MLFVGYNYNFTTKFVLVLSVFIFFTLLREPIMSNNLNTDKRIWVLKGYWKSQNSETVKRKWVETFGTSTPKRQIVYCIRDKFDATGLILNPPKTPIG